jgi:hypothetical protein
MIHSWGPSFDLRLRIYRALSREQVIFFDTLTAIELNSVLNTIVSEYRCSLDFGASVDKVISQAMKGGRHVM